ncbi:hypothetical protein KC960_02325 [Candidatus Saccharibacteria bacterium]|nr:hypothetical protein [Candidatus Saccharibacteria bacterium]
MAGELEAVFDDVTRKSLDIRDIISRILPRGHVIHGYSSAGSDRMLMVLETTEYTDTAPLLGFGIDGTAERALARALLTYAIREQQGLDYIEERQLPESREGALPPGNNNSRFDTIVWNGDIKLYQAGNVVHAWARYGSGNGLQPTDVEASDALTALELLADTYQFMNPTTRNLPAVSLDYVPFH